MEHSALSVALLRQRLVSLLTAMPAAQAGDETSVHLARVASRRLREALPVLGTRADATAVDRAGKRVRRITRALGPVRELDVTLSLLDELDAKGGAPQRALARVRKAVLEERQKRRRAMGKGAVFRLYVRNFVSELLHHRPKDTAHLDVRH